MAASAIGDSAGAGSGCLFDATSRESVRAGEAGAFFAMMAAGYGSAAVFIARLLPVVRASPEFVRC